MEFSRNSGCSNKMSSSSLELHICDCGIPCTLQMSWKERNPGRRFFGCSKYGVCDSYCEYFRWYDPPTPERQAKLMNSLLKKNKKLLEEVETKKFEILALVHSLEAHREEVKALTSKVVAYKSYVKKLIVRIVCIIVAVSVKSSSGI